LSWLIDIIKNEVVFLLSDWITKKFGWTKVSKRKPSIEELERKAVLAKRAKDRENRRKNR